MIIYYARFLRTGSITLFALILIILVIYFFVFSKKRFILVILNNLAFLGIIFFSSFFVYRFGILSPRFLKIILDNGSSAFIRVVKIISLSFLSDLAKVYSFVGLGLIFLAISFKIFLHIKKEEE